MTAIVRFEDIQAWQKARQLVRQVYVVTENGQFGKDYSLRDQLRRASVSVMSNIAEGFARRTPRDFANFLGMARSSTAEVQSQLYVALDLGYLSAERFRELYGLAEEISRMTQGFSKYLRANPQLTTRNSQLGAADDPTTSWQRHDALG